MASAPLPANEAERQLRVQDLCLTDSTPDKAFDRIVALTAKYFEAPIALISILDDQRQWFRASVGVDIRETPRRDAFCGYTILGRDVLEVSDATLDERFLDNPLVTGAPGIRFYAGVPLVTEDDIGLGSLCVIDTKPRSPLSERDLSMLKGFAGLVMGRIASLRDRNYIDEPTGLFNRLRLEADVALAFERHEELVVVAADMLSPRFINDVVNALGYPFFNEVILAMKERFQTLLPAGTMLYKISPTRFGFLLDSAHRAQETDLYKRILQAFQTPVISRGIPVRAEVGLGVLPLRLEQLQNQDWLRLVVSAANEARDRDIGWTHFEPRTDQAQQRAFTLLTELSRAIDTEDQFWLEYQPVLDLETGQCMTVEALLRWRHPTLGQIGPGEFIPLAEKTALMRPLSRWVLRRSIEQAVEWQRRGFRFKVAVNVSAQDLDGPSYVDLMMELLAQHGIDPSGFKIEFTESALMTEPEEVASRLRRARDAGVTVVIDDFGTGYSNWIYLRELPATVVKIDQSFVRNLAAGERDQRLAHSIIELARSMGFRVVAEGIETREALELLRSWGCNEGQGYFIARPMLPEKLIEWLDAHRPSAFASPPL
ncbi:sensor domain-containing phosphodiesterase [Bordetella genomosp. 10]|uniref:Sensor domain-containing phosphodiesterase n=1 Tax=Bordetella genomosp. 10 TaxID=1416804 RepID=A0A261S3V4_9BORD|nr:sensor domain-containing phosphodiesterase [Bordetella genomosp. 10]